MEEVEDGEGSRKTRTEALVREVICKVTGNEYKEERLEK